MENAIALKSRLEIPPGAQEDVCEVLYVDEALVRSVAAQMPAEDLVTRVTDIFKVLNDPTRVRIVFALSKADLCVCDLASLVGLSISAVSHQLRLLRSLGLVKYRKEGRLAYYSLTDQHTRRLLSDVLEHLQGGGSNGAQTGRPQR
jgi:DNA-binding transcriptional ArsR family regulator